MLNKKEGAGTALFFSVAIIILLTAHHGPLTWPGVAAAALGVIFSFAGIDALAAAAGIISASVSFTAQAMIGICTSCTYAAGCFAIAGLVSAARLGRRKPFLVVLFALPLVVGLFLYDYKLNVSNALLQQGKAAEAKTAAVTQNEACRPDVPMLYFSPWCEYCEEPLQAYVKENPEGKTWQPVVVPNYAMAQGEAMLRKMGYTGKLVSAPASPSGGIPCLQMPDGRLLVGRQEIMRVLKGVEKAN
ncbi:MAG: hypothetical protein PWQ39_169 [Thermacetogenium sp.]|nr:hypothetical protein [Thermacetogenium sp.]